jgi:g-D-glutamyl-meso-diaminopimelate peptidase
MKAIPRYLLNLIIVSLLIIITSFQSMATEFVYVDTSQQIYSYDSMTEDILQLNLGHEDILSYETIATTAQGRNVWLIKFGNLSSENKILITASIHAREYMSSQLVMRMLEEYVLNYDVPLRDGSTYRNHFDSVCFYIIPMVNPDGVSISQFGMDGAILESTKIWLSTINPSGRKLHQIKANSNGVDLNRNFPIGFGQGGGLSSAPGLAYYPGVAPLTEIETLALSNLIATNKFSYCINYHSMGKINYYGSSKNSPENAVRCRDLAALVSSVNKYTPRHCGVANGSFADYFYSVQNTPAVTIEIGTANPVPISQFSDIYNRNVPLWLVLSDLD